MFQGFKKGFSKGVKTLKDLKNRILDKIKFKKFKIVRKGMWFEIWAEVNPWVLLASGRVEKRSNKQMQRADGAAGKAKVGDKVILDSGEEGIVIGSHGAGGVGNTKRFVQGLPKEADELSALYNQLDELSPQARMRQLTGSGVPRNPAFRSGYFKWLETQRIKLSANAKKLLSYNLLSPFSCRRGDFPRKLEMNYAD